MCFFDGIGSAADWVIVGLLFGHGWLFRNQANSLKRSVDDAAAKDARDSRPYISVDEHPTEKPRPIADSVEFPMIITNHGKNPASRLMVFYRVNMSAAQSLESIIAEDVKGAALLDLPPNGGRMVLMANPKGGLARLGFDRAEWNSEGARPVIIYGTVLYRDHLDILRRFDFSFTNGPKKSDKTFPADGLHYSAVTVNGETAINPEIQALYESRVGAALS